MTPTLIIQMSCRCCLIESPDGIELARDEDCTLTTHFDVQGWPNIIDAAKAEILMDER